MATISHFFATIPSLSDRLLARRTRSKIGECSELHDAISNLSQRRQARFGDRRSRLEIFSQPLGKKGARIEKDAGYKSAIPDPIP
uniref:Uncharacterized protein n=1 Tax=Candidatus Kentrum sp. FM TaxID=2126340 RepID=A0A450TU61_9GAMM|nr:MAG: hypothetical protein BECKFM1743C_GA0114222_106441 [Candidatus Kentron sp. FM]